MTSGSLNSNCPIMDLPEELRGLIIRKVPQNESLNLRLVSRQWNLDVDNYFHFHINNLNENSPHFQEMIKLRIETLNILQLVETSILDRHGACIFKHPNLIRKLRISREVITEGNAPQSPMNLLRFCMKNLQELRLNLGNMAYPMPLIYNFENLKHLEIDISIGFNDFHEIEGSSGNFLQELVNSSMPKLRHLKLEVNFWREELEWKCHLILRALRLVAKHGSDLETLHLDFALFEFFGNPSTPVLDVQSLSSEYLSMLKIELEVLQKFNKLKDIGFRGMPEVAEENNFWQNLISTRRNLRNVDFTSRVIPFSSNLCRTFVYNNFATLVRIDNLTVRMVGESHPFNLAVFQSCLNLKVLCLSSHSDNLNTNIPRKVLKFINLNSLPQNITSLKLSGLGISSADLLRSSSDETQLTKLQKLELYYCSQFAKSGVTGTVLQNFLSTARNRSLVNIQIGSAFNYSNVEEREKLNALFTKFGYPLIESAHIYMPPPCFRLARDSVEEEWKNVG